MVKDITLGQFFPGNSLLHKTDARVKIVMLIVFLTGVLAASSPLAFAGVLVWTLALIFISRLIEKILFKCIKLLLFVLIFTAVMYVFFVSGEHLILKLGIVSIYREGIETACFMVLRLVCLVLGTSVILSYTTSPLDLTDGLESLLSPLKKLKVPVHEFSMMMTIALRFIPTLVEETDKIISAQKSRGVSFDTGGLKARIKALIPILVPLFYSALRRAYELAEAMETRLYHGGEGRTKMKVAKLKASDFIFLSLMITVVIGIFLLNKVELGIL